MYDVLLQRRELKVNLRPVQVTRSVEIARYDAQRIQVLVRSIPVLLYRSALS